MRDISFDFLKRLLETPSPSGFEVRGQRVWAAYAGQFAEKIESDSYGNVFAMLNPEGSPKILLAGHSDELGLMISHISEDGFLYFKGIGGVDRAMLRGRTGNRAQLCRPRSGCDRAPCDSHAGAGRSQEGPRIS